MFGTPLPPASQPPQSKPPEQPELAEAPFDDVQANLILRSSDEVPVHFRVFKNILSLASPIFADMFSIPSPSLPSEKSHDEVQVVTLSENSTALDIALRHIYPVQRTPNLKMDPLHRASILAEFSRKYQVEVLNQFIVGYLRDGIDQDPVGVYSIAVTYEYHDIGADAARLCLALPFSDLQSSYIRYANAEHILELLKYHVACGQAASALASSDRSWFSSSTYTGILTHQRWGNCQSCLVPEFVNPSSFGATGGQPTPHPPGVQSLFGATGGQPTPHTPGVQSLFGAMGGQPTPHTGVQSPFSAVGGRSSSGVSGFHSCNSENDDKELSERRSGPLCLWNYFYRSALVLAHHPTPEAITTEAFVLQTNDCPNCAPFMRLYMIAVSVAFGRAIKNAIVQVSPSIIYCRTTPHTSHGRFAYPKLFPRGPRPATRQISR